MTTRAAASPRPQGLERRGQGELLGERHTGEMLRHRRPLALTRPSGRPNNPSWQQHARSENVDAHARYPDLPGQVKGVSPAPYSLHAAGSPSERRHRKPTLPHKAMPVSPGTSPRAPQKPESANTAEANLNERPSSKGRRHCSSATRPQTCVGRQTEGQAKVAALLIDKPQRAPGEVARPQSFTG